jgi:hypothetical protein
MSTITTSSLSDTLPSTVPKLDAEGDNWAIFYVRFMDAVEAKGFWDHFDGSSSAPVTTTSSTEAELTAKKQWDKDERSAKTLLTQRLPDSTVMEIHSKKTVKERWEAVVKEYTVKGAYAQTEMRAKFLMSRCPEKGNARDFLRGLRLKKEELAQVGVKISDEDYLSTIISSLPDALSNFASMQMSWTFQQSQQTMDANTLMTMLLQEAERQDLRAQKRKQTSGKGKEDEKSEALAVSTEKPRGKRDMSKINCWNCGEPGHFSSKCDKPKKAKDNKSTTTPDSKKEGTSAAAVEESSDDEGAWAAEEVDGEVADWFREVIDGGGSSDDGDWFEEETASVEDAEEAPVLLRNLSNCLGFGSFDEVQGVEDDLPELLEVSDSEDEGDELEEELGGGLERGGGVEEFMDASGEAFVVAESVQAAGTAELYDSGCTNHISPYRNQFENFQPITPRHFRAANKQTFSTTGKGELVVDVPNGSGETQLRLHDVLYSAEVGYTLVSVGRLDEAGFTVMFGGGKCTLVGEDGVEIGMVPRTPTRVYKVEHEEAVANAAEERLTLDQFHRRMGHISLDAARKLLKDKMVSGIRLVYSPTKNFFCASCVYAKATRKAAPKMRESDRADVFGGEVHSDLWGKAPVESKGGKKYYVTFIDDKTRLTHLYLLAKKNETAKVYRQYEAWMETQMGAKIKVLNSDRGGEYQGEEFAEYLKSKGTHQKLNIHDTHHQTGVAERRNRTIAERIRALLHASGLPKNLWGEAARHVVWLLNRTTTKAVEGMTPFEAAFGKKPNLKGVREWGEKVYVRVEKGNKLGGRVREGRWLGMDEESKGARIYWPDTKAVSVERNIYFNNPLASRVVEEEEVVVNTNTDLPIVQPAARVAPVPENPAVDTEPVSDTSDTSDVAKRTRKPSKKIADLLGGKGTWSTASRPTLAPGVQRPDSDWNKPKPVPEEQLPGDDWTASVEECVDEYAFVAETSSAEALEPRSLAEAQKRPDWPLWEKAIEEELATLRAAGTWEVVDEPKGVNVVGSKWVFKAKKDASGNVVRYKARLVAQGFSQVPGVDYFDTFAPVARLASIRTVLAFAAEKNFETGQIDIKGAYLNGKLTEDEVIFMKQPPGYAEVGGDGKVKVLRLWKTLYGLKQAGRRWYQMLVRIMSKLGFSRCGGDQAVFFRRCEKTNVLIIVLVHVDDCSIVGNTKTLVARFKFEMAKFVDITDLGELHWILGIEVRRIREERKLLLSQKSYIDSILRRYGFEDLKPITTPMDPNVRLTSAQSPSTTEEIAAMRNVPYHEAVGSLMYATLGTRPDICFAVQSVSRFNSKPGLVHWEAVKRIFRYLKGTRDLWLGYGGVTKEMVGYADADGSMGEDRKAISGYAFMINGGAVSWSAKRQEIISLSTTESEYIAATYAAKEALWLRQLILQIFGINLDATTLFSDNQSAIALTKEHQYHARTKHIDVRFHFIRWIVEEGKIRLIYCPTEEMVADILTKALPSTKVKHFARELGLVSS